MGCPFAVGTSLPQKRQRIAASWICSAQKGQARTAVMLALIALARAEAPLAEEDRDEQRGDAEEFAEAPAVDGRADHGDVKEERQDRRGRRHEHDTGGHADGGSGSGGANSSFFPRMRRRAQAT